MNAVEIQEAIFELDESPFDPAAFPFAFLEAFGNKVTTVKRLKAGTAKQSDEGGVMQRGNIHIKVCDDGGVTAELTVCFLHHPRRNGSHERGDWLRNRCRRNLSSPVIDGNRWQCFEMLKNVAENRRFFQAT